MPLLVQCPCGQRLNVRDEDRGKRVRCPSCGTVLQLPASAPPPAPPPSQPAPPISRPELERILEGLGQLRAFVRQHESKFQVNETSPNHREYEKLHWLAESLQNYT